MKKLISLAVVVAFFIAVPQCFGQSQDTEKDAGQLLTEQQLAQMFHLAMVQQPEMTEVCHRVRGGPGDGVVLTVPVGPALDAHCRHGDCTEFYLTDEPASCVCGGDQQLERCVHIQG